MPAAWEATGAAAAAAAAAGIAGAAAAAAACSRSIQAMPSITRSISANVDYRKSTFLVGAASHDRFIHGRGPHTTRLAVRS